MKLSSLLAALLLATFAGHSTAQGTSEKPGWITFARATSGDAGICTGSVRVSKDFRPKAARAYG